MKILDIYFEDRLVYEVEVTDKYYLSFNVHSTDVKDLGETIASVPENYLIIIRDKK